MLNVLITVDTEVWPNAPDWRETALDRDLRRDVEGETATGSFGVPYQLEVLKAHNLKAVFLVEALFAETVGREPLRRLVQTIQQAGQEVQLHLHAEWLEWMRQSLLPGRTGQHLKDFSEDEQALLIERSIDHLRACGVDEVCAFRAGNYGANFATLRALARHGIRFDTSHNTCYLHSSCGLNTGEPLLQPMLLEGVCEFPVTFFRDWPGHLRHVQLCACSARELETALLDAWRLGWHSFVLVSHSFELIQRGVDEGKPPRPDRIVIRRFHRLCRFLDQNRDKFRTCYFADLDPKSLPQVTTDRPLRSAGRHTVWRFAEQLARRVL